MAITGAPELLIVMGATATPEQVDDVVARLEEAGCAALVTPGREATVIGAIGERELLAALPLEGYAGVEQVLPILKPYKLVSRELSPDPTVIEARGRRIGDGYFGFIAGRAPWRRASRRSRPPAPSPPRASRCCAAAPSSHARRRTPSRGSARWRSRSSRRRAPRPGCRS